MHTAALSSDFADGTLATQHQHGVGHLGQLTRRHVLAAAFERLASKAIRVEEVHHRPRISTRNRFPGDGSGQVV